MSGTPIINKPSEIAILYNMLKGLIKIYTFTIKSECQLVYYNISKQDLLLVLDNGRVNFKKSKN